MAYQWGLLTTYKSWDDPPSEGGVPFLLPEGSQSPSAAIAEVEQRLMNQNKQKVGSEKNTLVFCRKKAKPKPFNQDLKKNNTNSNHVFLFKCENMVVSSILEVFWQ